MPKNEVPKGGHHHAKKQEEGRPMDSHGFFAVHSLVRGNQSGWTKIKDIWGDVGFELDWHRFYKNTLPTHVNEIKLQAHMDGSFGLSINAVHLRVNVPGETSNEEHNKSLAEALRAQGFTATTSNVEKFPNTGESAQHIFSMTGSSEEIREILPKIFTAINSLERANQLPQNLQDEISASVARPRDTYSMDL